MLKTSDLNYRTLRNTENNFSKNTVEGIFVSVSFPSNTSGWSTRNFYLRKSYAKSFAINNSWPTQSKVFEGSVRKALSWPPPSINLCHVSIVVFKQCWTLKTSKITYEFGKKFVTVRIHLVVYKSFINFTQRKENSYQPVVFHQLCHLFKNRFDICIF